ncbi:Set1/Ash2 histone methyltransferase complex subunit ASH2 [Babesia microti strain RI]|uniref:Set1/Ash2 histone methyltransferase complex subunit ASH2 n=1 Tax=Babesia microti (strain RI) TaxID=1133968 RepID=A0A1R4AB25_BABMR|nr:Set1/Ash2 histone methyltransferase complex subunit ASH2 [Babesia microti strain RI]SJK86212.1 Set1/Ash2 histone methyltransferase complex subunit ASH2 [Babesia microti strain RI]|eukprot:XP_012648654.2 Set1/Ash2 histone methyltransferase complex subunit ASH2 [Babesia microti strain RI]
MSIFLRQEPEHNCFDYRYAASDPGVKFSDDRLRIIGSKQWNTALARGCAYHGQWYYECTIAEPSPNWMQFSLYGWDDTCSTISSLLKALPSLKDSIFPSVRVGWGTRLMKLDSPLGYSPFSYCISQINGDLIYAKKTHPGGENAHTLQVGDVIGCAINLCQPIFNLEDPRGNPDLWPFTKCGLLCNVTKECTLPPLIINKNSFASFSVNGKWLNNTIKPIYCAEYHPAVSTYMGSSVTINLGPKFKYNPPNRKYKAACYMCESKYPCKEDLVKYWVFADTNLMHPKVKDKLKKLNIEGVVTLAQAELGFD